MTGHCFDRVNSLQIAGDHILIYEAYYKQLDPKESNEIGALDAAKFLKKSGLSDVVLSRIWDLSDPTGRGFLNKDGFFVALKLIGLAQDGSDINMKNIYNVLAKPPRVGDLPKVPAQVKLVPTENTDWSMKPEKRQQYEQLFESLGPSGGLLPGAKVRTTLMNSKLPVDTLGRIWDLADQDRDGSLDKHEFCVAMHLVYEALDKRAIPATLPPQLQRNAPQVVANNNSFDAFGSGDGGFVANFPTDIAPPPVVPPLPAVTRPAMPPAIPPVPMVPLIPAGGGDPNAWVVTTLERCRYEEIFNKSDTDRDGLVSGFEIKEVFLQSGVPQNMLAQIWGLCDTNQSGKLRLEEFCLAMWFVDRAKKGVPPPEVLAPNMVPPSLRKGSLIAAPEPKPTYNNPELEMISKEIEELYKERRLLEQEVAQKEADVRIKRGEERSLQSEKDTLTATLKQLENQKGEAQKRLDDLKNQVNKIREQCQKQEDTLKDQEGELDSRRSELQKLKDEEQSLEREYNACTKDVDRLTSQLQDTQLEISQVKAMVTQIQECQRQMTDALAMFRIVIDTNDPSQVSDYSLKIEPEFREAKLALEEKEVENANKRDPFGDNKAASNGFGGVSDGETGFGDDFKTNGFATQFDTTNNGFQSGGGFDDGFANAFDNKPRADPFGSGAGGADPFAETRGTAAEAPKDEFGCDPFAILHAPTNASQALTPSPSRSVAPPRPESPSPALPPKKAKQPPPRPAPPRPLQGPTPTKPAPPATDAFGDSSGGGGFANFADFDNKNLKPATTTTSIIPSPSPVSALRFPPVGASPTPLPTSLLSATTTITSTSTVVPPAAPSPAPSAVSAIAAVDFVEDPFKDYRYEDPFNIEDPFADDAGGGGEDTGDIPDPFAANTNPLSTSAFTPKDRLEDLFGDALNNNFGALQITDADRFTSSTSSSIKKSSATATTADPFDAFNDNFSKKSNTDQELLFRAFGTTNDSTTTSAAFPETTTTTSGLKNASPFGDDDAFGKMDFSNNNISSNRNGAFDFANFGAFDTFSANTKGSNLSKSSSSVGSLKRHGAVRSHEKKPDPVPVPVKFNEDYSKDEKQFEADLQSILERSKFDQ